MADMNNSLVAGLFGITPQQVWQQQQQQQNDIAQQAFNNAAGTPGQLMAQGYANMGTSAVRLGAGMMGIEPDSVVQARQQQAIAQGVDFNDPKSIRERALQIQDPRMKFQYEAYARDVEAKIQASALQRAQENQLTAKSILDYAQADKALRENPNLHEVEVGVPGKPDYRQKVIIDKSNLNAQPVPVGSPYQIAAGVKVNMPSEKVRSQVITDNSGKSTLVNLDTGEVIKELGNIGKPSSTFEKNVQAKKQLNMDLSRAINELEGATKDDGLIDKSTGSGAGSLVDMAAGFFGQATPGAIAVGQLKPIYDMVLKMVPRFEGPQSDKDTLSYQQAAGQLANPAVPNIQKKAAAKEILRLMKARRAQFTNADIESSAEVPVQTTRSGMISTNKPTVSNW